MPFNLEDAFGDDVGVIVGLDDVCIQPLIQLSSAIIKEIESINDLPGYTCHWSIVTRCHEVHTPIGFDLLVIAEKIAAGLEGHGLKVRRVDRRDHSNPRHYRSFATLCNAVTIYPLTKEGKLNKTIEPFEVPANFIADQIKEALLARGIESPVRWYEAAKGNKLPEQYL